MIRIHSIAMRLPGRYVITLPPPAGHKDLPRHARELGFDRKSISAGERGFWTSNGRYVTRGEAALIAEQAGQRVRTTGAPEFLFAEDVW